MPLIKSKSKKAFDRNVASEMHAGKSQPQALAIAYSTKRAAQKKNYAHGGVASSEEHYDSIADAILRQKKNLDPGIVDISENAEEAGQAPYDDMNHEAYMKELYDIESIENQPEDSNLKSSMFSRIKKSRR